MNNEVIFKSVKGEIIDDNAEERYINNVLDYQTVKKYVPQVPAKENYDEREHEFWGKVAVLRMVVAGDITYRQMRIELGTPRRGDLSNQGQQNNVAEQHYPDVATPPSRPKNSNSILVELPDDLIKQINSYTEGTPISQQDIIRQALENFLNDIL